MCNIIHSVSYKASLHNETAYLETTFLSLETLTVSKGAMC